MAGERVTIVHIVRDDKFIDDIAYKLVELGEVNSRFIIPGRSRPLRYIKTTKVEFLPFQEVKNLLRQPETKGLLLHTLNEVGAKLIELANLNTVILWRGWGFDYYDNLLSSYYPNGLLLPMTRELIEAQPMTFRDLSNLVKRKVNRVLGRSVKINRKHFERINYFSPVLKCEYDMVVNANPWFTAKYIEWPLADLSQWRRDRIPDLTSDHTRLRDVLVGNSANPTNNHLEVFDLLKKLPSDQIGRIIVPLSYGGNSWYREQIVSRGREWFGDRFYPVFDFLEKEIYLNLLGEVGFFFSNHLRQQGAGNINLMLLNGVKVFMNSQSPLFRHYTKKGIQLYEVPASTAVEGVEGVLTPLTKFQIDRNINLVLNDSGREFAPKYSKTRALVSSFLSKVH